MTTPQVLGERYEIGGVLGRGGMAEVHRGRDLRLGREVAVKVLRSDLARDPSFQVRFRREAQASASLNHPAIVAVYDTGEDRTSLGATPYIVMEYVEGETLRDVLRREGPLPPERAMSLAADICGALDFSHRNGIVHRDVKPGEPPRCGRCSNSSRRRTATPRSRRNSSCRRRCSSGRGALRAGCRRRA